MFKAHHCLADGLALITLIMNLQDKYDIKQLPQMRKFSFFEKLYIYALTPFVSLKILTKLLFLESKQKNAIKNGKPLKGIKNAALTKDYSLEVIK